MRKKIIALIIATVLIISLIPTAVFATAPTIGLSVSAINGTTSQPRAMTDLRAGDVVTASVILPAGEYSSAQFRLGFDNTKFSIVNKNAITRNFVPKADEDEEISGWDNVTASSFSESNTNGYFGIGAVGKRYDEEQGLVSDNITITEDLKCFTVKFTVKEDASAGAATPFTILNRNAEDFSVNHKVGGVEQPCDLSLPEAVEATIVKEISTVSVTGTVTTPTKGGTDASSVSSSDGTTANVLWSPALVDGKFAANTAYTATITVAPTAGNSFAADATVSGPENFNFTKSGSNFVASYTFPATADKTMTGLTVTAQPTKTTYVHGDTFDQTGMVVKATYDDASEDTNFTGYTVSYVSGTALKKGDTKVTLTAGGFSADVTGLTVGAKAVTITGVTAENKEYDGTTNATANTASAVVDGKVGSDNVTVVAGTASFADSKAGDGKYVNFYGFTLGGADADNYTLSAQPAQTSANITKKALTATGVSAVSRAYDGTKNVTLTGGTLQGIVNSDHVLLSFSSATATVETADAGTGKAVTVSGVKLDGTAKDNYTLSAQPTGVTVNITKADYTSGSDATDTALYNASGAQTIDLGSKKPSDCGTAAFTKGTESVSGTATVTWSVDSASGQVSYTISNGTVGNIITMPVTISSTNYNDFTVNAVITLIDKEAANVTIANAPTAKTYGDTFTLTATAANAGTGTKTTTWSTSDPSVLTVDNTGKVTVVGVGSAAVTAKYESDTTAGQFTTDPITISAKSVTITGVKADNKEYDGTTDATVNTASAVVNGKVASDDVTVVAGTAAFANANVGTGKSVTFTGFTLGGAKAGNYTLSAQPAAATANITAKSVTVTGVSATNRAFDGTKNVTLTGGTVDGKIGSEDVTVDLSAATATVADANAANGKEVTVSGVKLSGAAAGNYTLASQPTGITVDITKATAPTVNDVNATLRYDVTTEQNVTLDNKKPSNCGTATFTKGTETVSGSATVTWNVESATGKVTYTVSNGAVGDIITMPVTISSTNYEDYTVKAVITLVDKLVPTVNADDYTTTYTGSAVDVSKITKSASVLGTWSWDAGTEVTNVTDTGSKTLVFTPNDTATYGNATINITVTINKATPTGAPAFTKITKKDLTLADAQITTVGATFNVDGTVEWVDADTTVVTQNKAYEWVFTPTDTANYIKLTGSAVVYKVSGGYAYFVDPTKDQQNKDQDSLFFFDVNASDYFYEAVKWAAENGITTGTAAYTFSSNAPCTRAQTVAFLWRAAGCPKAQSRFCQFTDVKTSDYFYDAVLWAAEAGITTGTSATTFSPDDVCTREQVVSFLYRMAGSPNFGKADFTDVKATSYASEAIAWAQQSGITTGTSATTFAPKDVCTRAQIVSFLYRYFVK